MRRLRIEDRSDPGHAAFGFLRMRTLLPHSRRIQSAVGHGFSAGIAIPRPRVCRTDRLAMGMFLGHILSHRFGQPPHRGWAGIQAAQTRQGLLGGFFKRLQHTQQGDHFTGSRSLLVNRASSLSVGQIP